MVLLHSRSGQAGHANAIATHFELAGLAVLGQEGGLHRLGVLGAQVEHVADLDTALNGQLALAVWREVAGDHIAQIGDHRRLGQVTAPVHTGQVVVGLVGTADPVGHHGHVAVHHQLDGLLQADRAQVTGLAAKVFFNLADGRKTEVGQALDLADLDLVHVMVTAQQQQPDLRAQDVALVIGLVGGQHQRFDGVGQRQVQQLGHIGAGALARRGRLGHGLRGSSTGLGRRQAFGLFDVGRVIAVGAVDDGVLAGRGNHLELFAQIATDGAAVCAHGTVLQAETVKDALVGSAHGLVADLGGVAVLVEGIGVLHDELAATHQAKAGAALVAELGLDLVEVLGQLLVAFELLARDVGHHLFAGGLDDEVTRVAVLDAQQLGTHLVETAGLLPQLGRLHHGHRHFDGASAVHLFAHDRLDLADHAQAHRHVVVDAGAELFDHAGAGH